MKRQILSLVLATGLLPLSATEAANVSVVNIAIIDGGFVDKAALESVYCPPGTSCLARKVTYWDCQSGSSCQQILQPTTVPGGHATKVGQILMDVLKAHQLPSDGGFSIQSVKGSPPSQFFDQFRNLPIVIVNTRGSVTTPSTCQNHDVPVGVNYVHATGNNRANGFAARSSSPLFLQDQLNCVPGVSSVAGLGHTKIVNSTGYEYAGVENCTVLENSGCTDYPLFLNSNFSRSTEFAASPCFPRTDESPWTCDGNPSNQGTSFAAPVVAGAYAALHRRSELTALAAKNALVTNSPEEFFTIETDDSDYRYEPYYSFRLVDDAAIGMALQSVPPRP